MPSLYPHSLNLSLFLVFCFFPLPCRTGVGLAAAFGPVLWGIPASAAVNIRILHAAKNHLRKKGWQDVDLRSISIDITRERLSLKVRTYWSLNSDWGLQCRACVTWTRLMGQLIAHAYIRTAPLTCKHYKLENSNLLAPSSLSDSSFPSNERSVAIVLRHQALSLQAHLLFIMSGVAVHPRFSKVSLQKILVAFNTQHRQTIPEVCVGDAVSYSIPIENWQRKKVTGLVSKVILDLKRGTHVYNISDENGKVVAEKMQEKQLVWAWITVQAWPITSRMASRWETKDQGKGYSFHFVLW